MAENEGLNEDEINNFDGKEVKEKISNDLNEESANIESESKIENNNENTNDKSESTQSDNTQNEEKKHSKLRSFFDTIGFLFSALVWILIILLVLLIVLSVSSKKTDVFGYRLYIIMSGSMEPTINIQDMIVTQESDDLKQGDIIAFENSNMIAVHRIVKVYTEGDKQLFQTKGDNNNTVDRGLVQKSQIKGKVIFKIPFIGKAIIYLQTHFIILILAIGILIIIVLVRRLI